MPTNKEPLVVSFSGGQSSGFLCAYLIENYGHKYDLRFVFANTGREHEETLIFADKVDKHFGLNLVWLEGYASPEHGVGMRHRVVSFETAARKGEPFESLISVEGIPNISRQKCSDYLKTQTIRHWMRSMVLRAGGGVPRQPSECGLTSRSGLTRTKRRPRNSIWCTPFAIGGVSISRT
ncbi:phosphoadenosine phosphosulfate reductase [Salmonella phage 35]|uniref:Portal protein n=1 Tax=Salmonella phage 35 TaxID=1654888 RepID=A0A0N6WGD4_9CAUD|nr:phosphoadenosine phosphosulfate reductase [Salmonella phage 35]AKJ74119.1 portal protein [Salmonella phage 35]